MRRLSFLLCRENLNDKVPVGTVQHRNVYFFCLYGITVAKVITMGSSVIVNEKLIFCSCRAFIISFLQSYANFLSLSDCFLVFSFFMPKYM